MSFDEPHPEYHGPALWPMWTAYAFGLVVSFLIVVLAQNVWGFLAYLPFAVAISRLIVLVVVRCRRFDRESDAWMKRMNAYYDRPLNARWN